MQIGVSYGSIQALQDNCTSTATQIGSIISELNTQLQPLAASWTGQAYEAYQADQTQWNNAQQDLSQVLTSIANALGVTNDNYQQTEGTNTKMFSSGS